MDEGFLRRLNLICRGRSHSEMARVVGVSQKTASNDFRGKFPPSLDFLVRLTLVEGLDLHLLITGKPAPSAITAEPALADASRLTEEQLFAELEKRAEAYLANADRVAKKTQEIAEKMASFRRSDIKKER